MMRLNLGCGNDSKIGYTNVDFRQLPGVDLVCDLSVFPWQWESNSVDEIIALDFVEHFSYRTTDKLLTEMWRILKPDGFVDIQVPDFEECARAAIQVVPYYCNKCGYEFTVNNTRLGNFDCKKCNQTQHEIAIAALNRLYGGQRQKDDGDWHFTAFTKDILVQKLKFIGFHKMEFLEFQHQKYNWNMKIRAFKNKDLW